MAKLNSVIQKINNNRQSSSLDRRLFSLVRGTPPKEPYTYRHKQTGEEFGFIVGVSWWPEKIAPGFIVIVGVRESSKDNPDFIVLDEYEDHNIGKLLLKCEELRVKWGYWACPKLFRPWHGEYEKYYSIIDSFNLHLHRMKGDEHGFYPTPPVILGEKNAFSICVRQVFSLLEKDDSGEKRLHIGECNLLRNHFLRLRSDDPRRWKSEHYPSLMAIGIAIHVLLESKPWLVDPVFDDAGFERYAEQAEVHTMKQFGQDEYDYAGDGELWGLDEDYPEEEEDLVSTVDK